MVKVFLARQPILDREGRIFAYELLFRSGFSGVADIRENEGSIATAKVMDSIISSFGMEAVVRNKKGFINIDENSEILEVVELLPPGKFGFEVLESSVFSEEFLNTLKRLKDLGYELSLDDFSYREDFFPYLELVDYVKIDVLQSSPDEVEDVVEKLKRFNLKLIAEKVETYENYKIYYAMDFDYFQGFFFQEPYVMTSKTIEPAFATLVKLYNMVSEERNVKEIEDVFKRFSDLSVKLLQLINSVYYALRQPVKSIRHAILMLGYKNILKWILLLMYSVRSKDFTSDPLFEEASIRGFFMEKLAQDLFDDKELGEKAFITGMLSLVDVLLGVLMEEAVNHLRLEKDIKDALLYRSGRLGNLLNLVEVVRRGNLKAVREALDKGDYEGLTVEKLLQFQTEAIKTYSSLEF